MGQASSDNGGSPFPGNAMMNGQPPFGQGVNVAGRMTPQQMRPGMPGGPIPNNLIAQNQVPPLDRQRFDNTYKAYCLKRNFAFNPASLQIENRQVDLWDLHRLVIEGMGFTKVCGILTFMSKEEMLKCWT